MSIKSLDVYFNKKTDFILYKLLKQTNIFIEMVICVAVDCKSDSRRRLGKVKVFINFQDTKI